MKVLNAIQYDMILLYHGIVCLRMWAGGGPHWQVNFTGQHSFCIFGQTARGSRYTGNSVVSCLNKIVCKKKQELILKSSLHLVLFVSL